MHLSKHLVFSLLITCLLLGIAIRIFIFTNSDHLDFESIFRTQDSYRFADNPGAFLSKPTVIHSGTGGQRGYYFSNSLLLYFVDNPIIITRLTSFAFGILSLLVYFYFVKIAFPIEVSLASAFMFSSYYIHAQLSVVPFANSGAIFFTLTACYFFLKFSNTKTEPSKIYLIFAAILILLATSFRMEMWILPPIFFLFLIFKKHYKASFIFLLVSSLYIIHTLYVLQIYRGNSFSFLDSVLWNKARGKGILNLCLTRPDMPHYGKYQITIWFNSLVFSLSSIAVISGFIGMLSSFKKKAQNFFLITFLSFLILLTARQMISNHFPFIRYSSILAIFFIPFMFSGLRKLIICLSVRLKQKLPFIKVAVISCLIVFFSFCLNHSLSTLAREIKYMRFQPQDQVHPFSSWIRRNVQSGDLVITSFSVLTINASALLNKLIINDLNHYDQYRLFLILEYLTKPDSSLNNKKLKEDYSHYNALYLSLLKHEINIRLISDQKDLFQKPKRIVFALNKTDLNLLQKNYPSFLQKVKLRHDGLVYFGSLNLKSKEDHT